MRELYFVWATNKYYPEGGDNDLFLVTEDQDEAAETTEMLRRVFDGANYTSLTELTATAKENMGFIEKHRIVQKGVKVV